MERKYEVPFSTCTNGHDLTQRSAVIYDIRNNRLCRECMRQNKTTKTPRKRGTFG